MTILHCYEGQKIFPSVHLVEGTPNKQLVTFTFYHDGRFRATLTKRLGSGPRVSTDRDVAVSYTLPAVPEDKTHYVVTIRAEAEDDIFDDLDSVKVWPRQFKLEAQDRAGKSIAGFRFEVKQHGTRFGSPVQTMGTPAKAHAQLDKGSDFSIAALPPYAIIDRIVHSLRNFVVKVDLQFLAKFERPTEPIINQYVNLLTEDGGCDGKGAEVELTIAGVPHGGDLAREVFITVTFGPNLPDQPDRDKSPRTSPKTELLAGLAVKALTEVEPRKEYTAKITLDADGKGKAKLQLGEAGGDTCTVKIGSTEACDDDEVTFINWRKLYYEILAADCMSDDLEDQDIEDGSTAKGFPAAIRTELKRLGDPFFIELVLAAGHIYLKSDVLPPQQEWFVPASYSPSLDRRGDGEVLVLSGDQLDDHPKRGLFDPDRIQIILSDLLIYEPQTTIRSDDFFPPHSDDPVIYSFYIDGGRGLRRNKLYSHRWLYKGWQPGGFRQEPRSDPWLCRTPFRPSIKWSSEHDFLGQFDVRFREIARTDRRNTIHTKYVNIRTSGYRPNCEVRFHRVIGPVGTDLSDKEKRKIDDWLGALLGSADKPDPRPQIRKEVADRRHAIFTKEYLAFSLTAEIDPTNPRRVARVETVKAYLKEQVDAFYENLRVAIEEGRQAPVMIERKVDLNKCGVQLRAQGAAMDISLPEPPYGPSEFQRGRGINVTITTSQWGMMVGMTADPSDAGDGPIRIMVALNAYSEPKPKAVAGTIWHEVAHTLDLVNVDHQIGEGIAKPKTINEAEPIVPFQKNGTKGHQYRGHGHLGGHCAYGLTDADKGRSSYIYSKAQCTMFGQNPSSSFCPQCIHLLRAANCKQ